MRSFFLTLLLTVSFLRPIAADAATPTRYASFYPKDTRVYLFRHVTNGEYDCDFGFLCEGGRVLFHRRTQSDLGRTGGWCRTAIWLSGQKDALFVIYSSTYADSGGPISNAVQAWDDLRGTVGLEGWQVRAGHPNVGSDGHFAWYTNSASFQQALLLVATQGNREVEALMVSDHMHRAGRAALRRDLVRQVRAALYGEGP